jgi:endo-1,4-beta-xylanase
MLPLLFWFITTWTAGPVVLAPGPAGAFDETAVKDPSVVRHDGQWHVFYTARGQGRYSLGYVTAANWAQLADAPRHELRQLKGASDPTAAAPQVFYFRPQRRWYLIYQTKDSNYQPVFSTSSDLSRPELWTEPKPLVEKRESAKWIDFWVLCDQQFAYLYFTRAHEAVYVSKTPLQQFPSGWDPPKRIFGPVHESCHVYRAPDRYIMLFETQTNDLRSYGLAEAPTPEGPWREADRAFATNLMLRFAPGVQHWTAEVSHGELIRSGFDERMQVDKAPLQFLIQGLEQGTHRGAYEELKWRLGVITQDEKPRPGV